MNNILRILGLLLCLHTGIKLNANSSYWNEQLVRSYVHSSELQRRWAWSFLAPHLKTLNGNEEILDVGCGDGRITADISRFVPSGNVIGIDPSLAMLEWAKKQYHPLEYPNLHFQEGGFLSPNSSQFFDLIVSFCALQHCPDQKAALQTVRSLLKKDGKLLILVPLMQNSAWNQARATVQARPQWVEYWKEFVPRKFPRGQQYKELLEAADFQVVKVEEMKTMDSFTSLEEILDWLLGTFAPIVPATEARQFYQEWIDEYLRLDPQAISPEGVIYAKLGYIGIEAINKTDSF